MIKALKKLKTWSRKKKRRKSKIVHPPLHSHCCCSCSSAPQPSAPPLPSWLDYEPQQETLSVPSHLFGSFSESGFTYASAQPQSQIPPSEIATETTPLYAPSAVPSSYQQYFVPEPVCGVPTVPVVPKKRAEGGIF